MDIHENARTLPHSGMLIAERLAAGWPVVTVAVAAGVTAKTVRKWRDRHAAEGIIGLADRSSRPRRSPARLSTADEDAIEALRRQRENLKQALTLTRVYEQAVREFMEMDTPTSLKDMVIGFSRVISDQKHDEEFARNLAASSHEEAVDNPILRELNEMRERWPGKTQVFDRVIFSALAAAVYLWPAVTKDMSTWLIKININREREVNFTVQTVDSRGLAADSGVMALHA